MINKYVIKNSIKKLIVKLILIKILIKKRSAPIVIFFTLMTSILFTSIVTLASQRAIVKSSVANVYSQLGSGGKVIAKLKRGDRYEVSDASKDGYHKIRVNSGKIGWISAKDIAIGVMASDQLEQDNEKIQSNETLDKQKSKARDEREKPYENARYRGVVLDSVAYKETTVGKARSEPLNFYGLRWVGDNTIMEEGIYADGMVEFHLGAPSYYDSITGQPADGWIILAHFTMDVVYPQSKYRLITVGFGPLIKYSQFSATIASGADLIHYNMSDLNLGVLFKTGLALQMSKNLDMRMDIKYFWEKEQYMSMGIGFGWLH